MNLVLTAVLSQDGSEDGALSHHPYRRRNVAALAGVRALPGKV